VRSSSSISGTQEHLLGVCRNEPECVAIDYRATGGYGHMCSDVGKKPPSSGYVFCAKSLFGQAAAYGDYQTAQDPQHPQEADIAQADDAYA